MRPYMTYAEAQARKEAERRREDRIFEVERKTCDRINAIQEPFLDQIKKLMARVHAVEREMHEARQDATQGHDQACAQIERDFQQELRAIEAEHHGETTR